MARSLWKGAISFGLVHIPVELYTAVQAHDLDLSMLDKRDFSPIGFKRYNKNNGKEVSWDNIVKGYEYMDGEYVVLSEEDLRQANPKATQTIDILAFVDADTVPLTFYDTPYYLGPGRGGDAEEEEAAQEEPNQQARSPRGPGALGRGLGHL